MTDKPILFSGPMVRAILREIRKPGTGKTQTRRIHKSIPISEPQQFSHGDRLWVRETWAQLDALTHIDAGSQALTDGFFYRADESTVNGEISRWTPSIHMPRWASRITLKVTDVRVQRLQEISREDCVAEGCKGFVSNDGEDVETPEEEFSALWDSLNAERAPWADNPWVVAVTFRPHLTNIDSMEKAG